jgi:hypothetical protein
LPALRPAAAYHHHSTFEAAAPLDCHRHSITTTLPHDAPTEASPAVDDLSTVHNVHNVDVSSQ